MSLNTDPTLEEGIEKTDSLNNLDAGAFYRWLGIRSIIRVRWQQHLFFFGILTLLITIILFMCYCDLRKPKKLSADRASYEAATEELRKEMGESAEDADKIDEDLGIPIDEADEAGEEDKKSV